ncbi:unnamed protein product [Tilletia laevis]|uniref:Zn(2)-C6 fungal-type domain-containing protein n=2 Tax=Tilletia TaxID=13289 RepID=A0A8T8TRS6_9BASI|nr:hypothetical protein CF336_g2711 [Tilletia laevis]KAE8265022.1 hypothetical protein A4X03_0g531 [Tilletia caries]KAE8198090.1 hypothetical protein CF335_g4462 [Tilletia laevis]CAD6941526.1 unnamed protein product [Tilletia caries]CAD6950679.1 unnamed protein product [Tilletia caries]
MSIRPDKGYRCDLCRAIGGVQACRYEGDPAVDNSVGCANCKTNKVECSFLHEVGWRHQPKGKEVYIAPAEVLFRPLRRKRKAAALDGGGDGNGNGSGKEEERWFAFDGEDKAFLKPTQEEPSDTQLALMRLRSGAPPSSSSPKQTTTTARRPSKSPTASASSSTSKRPKPSSSTTNRVQATKMLPPPPPKQNRSKQSMLPMPTPTPTPSPTRRRGDSDSSASNPSAPAPAPSPSPAPARARARARLSARKTAASPVLAPESGSKLLPPPQPSGSAPTTTPAPGRARQSSPTPAPPEFWFAYTDWLRRRSDMRDQSTQTDPDQPALDSHVVQLTSSFTVSTAQLLAMTAAQGWDPPHPTRPGSAQIVSYGMGSAAAVASSRCAASRSAEVSVPVGGAGVVGPGLGVGVPGGSMLPENFGVRATARGLDDTLYLGPPEG